VTVAPAELPSNESALNIQRPLVQDLGEGLRLLGSSFDSGPYRPGEQVPVTLFWKATADGPAERQITLSAAEIESTGAPGGQYRLPHWRSGELIRDIRTIAVPNADSSSVPLVLSAGPAKMTIGNVDIAIRAPILTQPETTRPGGEFANGVRLKGANVLADGRPISFDLAPRRFDVELVWQADRQQSQDLSVFIHVVGEDGRPIAQHDGRPVDGAAPVTGWRAGEYLVDRHPITIPATAPAGAYQVIAGLYPPPNGARVAVISGQATQANDAIVIAHIRLP
jgi:hypothetical protein